MRMRNRVGELLMELHWTSSRLHDETRIGRATAYRLKRDPYYLGDGRALHKISDRLKIPIHDLIAIETNPKDVEQMLTDPTIAAAVERMRDKRIAEPSGFVSVFQIVY